MTEARVLSLITGRMAGVLSVAEALELDRWASEDQANAGLLERLTDETQLEREMYIYQSIDPARGFAIWMDRRHEIKMRRRYTWIGVAASLLIAVAVPFFRHRSPVVDRQSVVVTQATRPSRPNRNKAMLTLADGQLIQLDTTGKGEIATQGNARVIKTDSSLRYDASGQQPALSTYNILATPKSHQYHVTLADGTQVWLNNESTLRYPVAFGTDNRTVELSGEAYFMIAPDAHKPFKVLVKNGQVEVLGTSFNVTAYSNEANMRTTLVEGSVRIRTAKGSVQLRPDEQAQVDAAGKWAIAKGLPAQDIAAWKDGYFYFGRADLAGIMRQLGRWYDVEIVSTGKLPTVDFEGKIDRSLPLQELIEIFDKNKIHLQLNGRKLYVLPN